MFGVQWCLVGILFFKGDYILAVLGSITYTIVVAQIPVLKPVRKQYPYFAVGIGASFIFHFGIVYTFGFYDLDNVWRTLATLPVAFYVYWFYTRKVRPILNSNKKE